MNLTAQVEINYEILPIASQVPEGIVIQEEITAIPGGEIRRIVLQNHTDATIKVGNFSWEQTAPDKFADCGKDLRVFLEGWTMTTPVGVRHFGDCDFNFNPEYLKFAICEPDDYTPDTPNVFRAEHMIALRNLKSEKTRLYGFISSGRMFGRFQLRLGKDGVNYLSARCSNENAELDPGECLQSEKLLIIEDQDDYQPFIRFAEFWGKEMGARNKFPAPTGWCSWYYYFLQVKETDILENVEFLATHRDQYDFEYIQLDAGYYSNLGDWLTCNEKFPHGLEYLAQKIQEKGFKPALWVAPFMVSENSRLLKEHPEWMIHNAMGDILFPYKWGTRIAVLDGTHPGTQEHFKKLFAQIRQWGFSYTKLDFMMLASSVRDGVLYDRKATRAQALRKGMEAIRAGFGEDGFILGCTVPLGPVVGLVDGERISSDITLRWEPEGRLFDEAPAVQNVCRNVINHSYLHRRLWMNDPDTLIVRDDNTELLANEVRLWADVIKLAGGMLLLGDRLSTLPPERQALVIETLRNYERFETRPLDVWDNTVPEVWQAKDRENGEKFIGCFNFAAHKRESQAGTLPAHSSKIIKSKI